MGLDSDRVLISSRNLSVCIRCKPIEPNCFYSGKQKHFSSAAVNATEVQYSLIPIKEKAEEKMPSSSFRSLEVENSWNSKCQNGGNDFTGSTSVKDVSKSNMPLNVKTKVNYTVGSPNQRSGKLGVKTNGASGSITTSPSTCPIDSRKSVKHLRSPSFSEENHNSVIRKKEMGFVVHTPGKIAKSKNSVPINNKKCLNENSNKSHIGAPEHGDPKIRNIFSFGNIYRGPKNTVLDTVPPHKKDTQVNDTVLQFKGNGLDCGISKPKPSNNHVLGFGRGNYGHGSIIRGVKAVEIPMKSNSLVLGCKNKEEKHNCTIPSMAPHFERVGELKNAGNEEYRRGRFMEAISFYDKAISLCPRNAPCHNNKAAALSGLGRYMEAVEECLEAINCDPLYSRAHYRLGNLYTRLGWVKEAKQQFGLLDREIVSEAMQNLQHLEAHLMNIKQARKLEDWDRMSLESTLAIEAGADASYQVLASKAEALLKLHKAKEALELLMIARKSVDNKSRKSHKGETCLLFIETQVYMYLGRFDDGVMAAEHAVNLDAGPESLMWLRKARAVADARKAGNEFFKAGRYLEACMAYSQGLEYSPANSVLLCNRAACRAKLGQWEMTVSDCNAALRYRPDYTKALLRRAHSNARLERWEESLRDYQVLNKEMPEDLGITNSLLQVQMELKRAQVTGAYKFETRGWVTHLTSYS